MSFGDEQRRDGCVDNGKYKQEYRIDRRCYVTDEQKKQSPFNSVVALVDNTGNIYCTGTIVSIEPAKDLYVYTAAHCALNVDTMDTYNHDLRVRLQNGKEITVTKVNTGNFLMNIGSGKEDWAIYQISKNEQKGLPYVHVMNWDKYNSEHLHVKKNSISGPMPWEIPYNVIGYGSFPISTNKEIKLYKKLYVMMLGLRSGELPDCDAYKNSSSYDDFEFRACIKARKKKLDDMQQEMENSSNEYFSETGGIRTEIDMYGLNMFAQFLSDKLNDDALKYSMCYQDGGKSGRKFCQSWNGDSGGGIFVDNELVAIVHGVGDSTIGGKEHLIFLDSRAGAPAKSQASFLPSEQENFERINIVPDDDVMKMLDMIEEYD